MSYHDRIMNIECGRLSGGAFRGYRAACNAAAEIANGADEEIAELKAERDAMEKGMNIQCEIRYAETSRAEAAESELEAARKVIEKLFDTWKRAGPQGSHQFEKFDTVVRWASMFLDGDYEAIE